MDERPSCFPGEAEGALVQCGGYKQYILFFTFFN